MSPSALREISNSSLEKFEDISRKLHFVEKYSVLKHLRDQMKILGDDI